jgi:hypothetical protein
MTDREHIEHMAKLIADELIAQGKLIEAGWRGYQMLVMPADAGYVQIDETRRAFFAGAQHLFGTMINMFDPDAEPTMADLAKMDNIDHELRAYLAEFKRRHGIGDKP